MSVHRTENGAPGCQGLIIRLVNPRIVQPKEAPAGWLNENQLREYARTILGVAVSHQQFDRYDAWGLLGRRDGDWWEPEAAERIVAVQRAELDAKFLPRRVLRLEDNQLFRFSGAILRKAVLKVLKGIERPADSLLTVHQAMSWLRQWQIAQHGQPSRSPQMWLLQERIYPPDFPEAVTLPSPSEWAGIVTDPSVPDEDMKGLSIRGTVTSYRNYDQLMQQAAAGQATKYEAIPPEHRIALLTVRHLALTTQAELTRNMTQTDQRDYLRSKLAQL